MSSHATEPLSVPTGLRWPYIILILCAVLAASYYRLRTDTIFGCQATGYSADKYLSYCQTTGYGDYDHGAYWFSLRPEATRAASAAQLLFVGNSRMEYAFSSATAQQWLQGHAPSYYLLGFAYHPQVLFEQALMRRIHPHPRLVVVNLDAFFQEKPSVPALMVMKDPTALTHYQGKQRWQVLHRLACARLTWLCGNTYSIFRDGRTGAWQGYGVISANEAVSADPKVDDAIVAQETASGRKFLDELGVDRRCVIFTLVPTVDAQFATGAAIATALNVEFIAPQLEDLLTFDGSHLDKESAERWSGAFFDLAGARIQQCLSSPAVAVPGKG